MRTGRLAIDSSPFLKFEFMSCLLSLFKLPIEFKLRFENKEDTPMRAVSAFGEQLIVKSTFKRPNYPAKTRRVDRIPYQLIRCDSHDDGRVDTEQRPIAGNDSCHRWQEQM